MEEALLPSGSTPADSRRQDGVESTVLGRRERAIAGGDRYQKAAAMVDQAEDGVGLPVEVLKQPNFEHCAKLYFWFIWLNPIWALNLTILLLLNFFEVPLWCREDFPNPCGNPEKYYLGGLPYLTRTESLILEVTCVVILAVHTFFPIAFNGNKLFWDTRLDNIKVLLLVLLAGDTIFNLVYVAPWGPIEHLPFRLGPYIRVLIVVVNLRGLRDCVKTLAGILGDFLDIAALLLLFLLFSSWLAFILFEDTIQGKTLFKTYGDTLYQMSILYTTSNNPDVWLPAYKQSRFSAIFFVIYILFGVYFVANLVLSVVYDSFKGQLAKLLVEAENARQEVLSAAFDLLDDQGRGYLDKQQCGKLFNEIKNYRTLPHIADEDIEAVFYALDDSGDFKINREEFSDLCNAISLKFDKADEPAYLEKFPRLYHSQKFEALKRFVRSDLFEKIVIGMLLVNLVAVIIETTLDIQNSTSQKSWQYVEFALGWLYVVEMVLKVVVYGFNNYWRSAQNRFDFVITVTIVVAETLTYTLPNKINFFANEEWIRYLLIARLLRLTRLLVLMERYQVMVSTFLKLIPSLMPYLGITFCIMCFFCTLGVQAFGGIIYDGNPRLPGSAIEENDYMVKNFNDFPSGMVVLFDLLITGNWHIWMDGFQEVTGKWWTQFYFWSFYVLAVLFLFNLVVAFVLEAFFAEMEMHSAAKESEAASDGDSSDDEDNGRVSRDPRDPRNKVKRARNDNVSSLLNHILSAEIEKTRSVKQNA
jgi:two pore calcium channel protein